jgi:hypothetical protein
MKVTRKVDNFLSMFEIAWNYCDMQLCHILLILKLFAFPSAVWHAVEKDFFISQRAKMKWREWKLCVIVAIKFSGAGKRPNMIWEKKN